jgi:outer membrane lipoprotein
MRIISLLLALLLSACVSVPEPLQVSEQTTLASYEEVLQSPQQYIGQTARWGGVIAAINNLKDKTRVEIVHFNLKESARPKVGQQSAGRFVVYINGLLDPMIYKVGTVVSTVGTIADVEQGKIGEFPYTFPVLMADSLYIWKKIERIDVDVVADPFWHAAPYWYYPYSPYSHNRITVTKRDLGNTSPKPPQQLQLPKTR